MAEIPDDVCEAILSKLPIKSLLRFSCASKTWYFIISDPKFRKMIRRPGAVLMCENLRGFSTGTAESLLMDQRVPCPWETSEPDDRYVSCLGSCNGLICVDRRNDRRAERCGLILCNPSTRKFRTLPRPRCYMEEGWWNYAWFGYDESIDDYKIVWVNFTNLWRRPDSGRVAKLDVFTMKSNTWRTPEADHLVAQRERDAVVFAGGVLCNNAIHWSVRRGALVFDLATEKFRLEHSYPQSNSWSWWLGSLDGERLWICNNDYEGYTSFLVSSLWVMKEYGVKSSWTKVLSIRQHYGRRYRYHFQGPLCIYPVLFSRENKGEEMAVICNFWSETSRRFGKVRVEGGRIKVKKEDILLGVSKNPFTIVVPMEESLVSID